MRKTSEVENPSPGQKLGMAVPDRTISTLHLLSIPPQTWGRTLPNPAVAVLVYCFTQHQLAASFCFPPFFTVPSGLFSRGSSSTATCGASEAGWDHPRLFHSCARLCRAGLCPCQSSSASPWPLQQPFVPHFNQSGSFQLHGHLSSSF